MELYKATFKNFDYPLFSIACASRENLSSLKISDRIGIRCEKFKTKCKELFASFLMENEYSIRNIEEYFCIQFCFLRIENGKILSFEDTPKLGQNVLYVHKK